jgi:CBS domain-containing protein
MTVSELYESGAPACSPETTLAKAGRLMVRDGIDSLPVVDPGRRVIGMVTDDAIADELRRSPDAAAERTVGAVLSDRWALCHPQDRLRDALRLMGDHEIARLPVVDLGQRLKGVLAIDDLLCRALTESYGRDLPKEAVIDAFCRIVGRRRPLSRLGGTDRGF